MASTTPADDEIRRILNDEDIERLRKRFLCALKDMDNNNTNSSYDFDQVYDRMGLGGYDLPLAMGRVIEDYLLSQGLIQIDGERVRITETGRHRYMKTNQNIPISKCCYFHLL